MECMLEDICIFVTAIPAYHEWHEATCRNHNSNSENHCSNHCIQWIIINVCKSANIYFP